MLEQVDQATAAPEFDVALRGYDRAQVDGYLEQLRGWHERERLRFETTKQNYAKAYREVDRQRDGVADELDRLRDLLDNVTAHLRHAPVNGKREISLVEAEPRVTVAPEPSPVEAVDAAAAVEAEPFDAERWGALFD